MSPLYGQHSYFDFERGLNLTDEQRSAAEEVKRKYMHEWRRSGKEVGKKKFELRNLYRNPSFNRENIEKLQKEILEIEIERENLYNRYRGEVSRILNEEQREKYDNFCGSERKRSNRPSGLMRRYGR